MSSSQPLANGQQGDIDDRSWRWRHSAWMLAPILGIGLFSFVGFAYCAARVRATKWIVLACVSAGLTLIGWILLSSWTAPNGDASNAATTYILGLWLVSIVFAFVVNKDYLIWRSSEASSTPVSTSASEQASDSPVAGWYPDAARTDLLRYWDGQAWTEHTAPRTN